MLASRTREAQMKRQSKLALAIFAGTLLAVLPGAATAQTVVVATGAPAKVHLLPATMETTQLGWYEQCAEAGAHHQARRQRRHGNNDAFPRSPRAGRELGHAAQDSPGVARPRRAYPHRADLCRRRRAWRRAQGADQQNR